MNFLLLAAIGQAIVKFLLIAMAIFLILLVLVQRGRGGGLAGALGGMGGSSAFGAKAGDVFTRVTIGASFIWIVLCIAAVNLGPSTESRLDTGGRGATAPPPASTGPGLTAPAEKEEEAEDEGPTDEIFSGDEASSDQDLSSDSSSNDTEEDSTEASE